MTILKIDHFAIACDSLCDGTDYVQDTLGVLMGPIGHHPKMGTFNRLLSLGPETYLEVIAIDPDAPIPQFSRWFNLDAFAGAPRITNWICSTSNLNETLASAPKSSGVPMAFERGQFQWEMGVPRDGKLPYDGAYPALIQWHGNAHPASLLEDMEIRLRDFAIHHPKAKDLAQDLGPLSEMVKIEHADQVGFELILDTSRGERSLT